jgi:hypothetical protein
MAPYHGGMSIVEHHFPGFSASLGWAMIGLLVLFYEATAIRVQENALEPQNTRQLVNCPANTGRFSDYQPCSSLVITGPLMRNARTCIPLFSLLSLACLAKATVFLVLTTAFLATTTRPMAADDTKTAVTLQAAREPGQIDRVELHLEVGGETQYTEESKAKREKMSVTCDLEYVEKTLETPEKAAGTWRSIRDYVKVAVDVKVGDGRFKPALKPEHRTIAVEAGEQTADLFSPAGNLTREELDSIDVQANSLLLDRLLPEKAVAIGDEWAQSPGLLAAMLGLDEVAKTTVKSTLKEVTESVARFEIAGRVEGAIYGVSTVIDVKGRYRFDRKSERIDWLGMLIKELRPGSFVADGVDVVSRLAIKITPIKEADGLADAKLTELALKPAPEMLYLAYEAPQAGWQCRYDRRWYLHHQRPKVDVAVLRLVDRGMLAGQCNLGSLPKREPDKLVTLEEFQEDVRKALGKSFGEFVEAGQSANAANCRVYRVVAQGTSSDIPVRWIYYLVSDAQGRQVALTFTIEQKLAERFGDADKPLVQSLQFTGS